MLIGRIPGSVTNKPPDSNYAAAREDAAAFGIRPIDAPYGVALDDSQSVDNNPGRPG